MFTRTSCRFDPPGSQALLLQVPVVVVALSPGALVMPWSRLDGGQPGAFWPFCFFSIFVATIFLLPDRVVSLRFELEALTPRAFY